MPDKTKQLAADAARSMSALPTDVREMAARLAETYATGLATGMELAGAAQPQKAEG